MPPPCVQSSDVLYDVTARREALVVRAEVKDLCLIPCRCREFEVGGKPDRKDIREGGSSPDKVVSRQHGWMA